MVSGSRAMERCQRSWLADTRRAQPRDHQLIDIATVYYICTTETLKLGWERRKLWITLLSRHEAKTRVSGNCAIANHLMQGLGVCHSEHWNSTMNSIYFQRNKPNIAYFPLNFLTHFLSDISQLLVAPLTDLTNIIVQYLTYIQKILVTDYGHPMNA